MVMAMLYPSSQLIKGIVEEKESRTRETMKVLLFVPLDAT